MKRHHVIYIPGIGDHKAYLQPQIISFWKVLGVRPHYHPVIWRGTEKFQDKLAQLVELIDQLSHDGTVSLVGVSAGATAAFNAYCARKNKVKRVVFICGKLRRPETVGSSYYKKNPAFKESLEQVQKNLENLNEEQAKCMLSLIPLRDQVVPLEDMLLPGIRTQRMLTINHVPSIFLGITIYSPIICGFIKRGNNE